MDPYKDLNQSSSRPPILKQPAKLNTSSHDHEEPPKPKLFIDLQRLENSEVSFSEDTRNVASTSRLVITPRSPDSRQKQRTPTSKVQVRYKRKKNRALTSKQSEKSSGTRTPFKEDGREDIWDLLNDREGEEKKIIAEKMRVTVRGLKGEVDKLRIIRRELDRLKLDNEQIIRIFRRKTLKASLTNPDIILNEKLVIHQKLKIKQLEDALKNTLMDKANMQTMSIDDNYKIMLYVDQIKKLEETIDRMKQNIELRSNHDRIGYDDVYRNILKELESFKELNLDLSLTIEQEKQKLINCEEKLEHSSRENMKLMQDSINLIEENLGLKRRNEELENDLKKIKEISSFPQELEESYKIFKENEEIKEKIMSMKKEMTEKNQQNEFLLRKWKKNKEKKKELLRKWEDLELDLKNDSYNNLLIEKHDTLFKENNLKWLKIEEIWKEEKKELISKIESLETRIEFMKKTEEDLLFNKLKGTEKILYEKFEFELSVFKMKEKDWDEEKKLWKIREQDWDECRALWEKNEKEWEREKRILEDRRIKWKNSKHELQNAASEFHMEKSKWELMKSEYEKSLGLESSRIEAAPKVQNKVLYEKIGEIQKLREVIKNLESEIEKIKSEDFNRIEEQMIREINQIRADNQDLKNYYNRDKENLKNLNRVLNEKDLEITSLKAMIKILENAERKEKELYLYINTNIVDKDMEISGLKGKIIEIETNFEFRQKSWEKAVREKEEEIAKLKEVLDSSNSKIIYSLEKISKVKTSENMNQEAQNFVEPSVGIEASKLSENLHICYELILEKEEEIQNMNKQLKELKKKYKKEKKKRKVLIKISEEKDLQVKMLEATAKENESFNRLEESFKNLQSEYQLLQKNLENLEAKHKEEQESLSRLLENKQAENSKLNSIIENLENEAAKATINLDLFKDDQAREIEKLLEKIDIMENDYRKEKNTWSKNNADLEERNKEIQNLVLKIEQIDVNYRKDKEVSQRLIKRKDSELQKLLEKIGHIQSRSVGSSDIFSSSDPSDEKDSEIHRLKLIIFDLELNHKKEREIWQNTNDIIAEKEIEILTLSTKLEALQNICRKDEEILKDSHRIISDKNSEIQNLKQIIEKIKNQPFAQNEKLQNALQIISEKDFEIQSLRKSISENDYSGKSNENPTDETEVKNLKEIIENLEENYRRDREVMRKIIEEKDIEAENLRNIIEDKISNLKIHVNEPDEEEEFLEPSVVKEKFKELKSYHLKQREHLLKTNKMIEDREAEIERLQGILFDIEEEIKTERELWLNSKKIIEEKDLEIHTLKILVEEIESNNRKEKKLWIDSSEVAIEKNEEIQKLKNIIEELVESSRKDKGKIVESNKKNKNKEKENEKDKEKISQGAKIRASPSKIPAEIYSRKESLSKKNSDQIKNRESPQHDLREILENSLSDITLQKSDEDLHSKYILTLEDDERNEKLGLNTDQEYEENSIPHEFNPQDEILEQPKEDLMSETENFEYSKENASVDEIMSPGILTAFGIDKNETTEEHKEINPIYDFLNSSDKELAISELKKIINDLEIKHASEHEKLNNFNKLISEKEEEISKLKNIIENTGFKHLIQNTEPQNLIQIPELVETKLNETAQIEKNDSEVIHKKNDPQNFSEKDEEIKNLKEMIEGIQVTNKRDKEALVNSKKTISEIEKQNEDLKKEIENLQKAKKDSEFSIDKTLEKYNFKPGSNEPKEVEIQRLKSIIGEIELAHRIEKESWGARNDPSEKDQEISELKQQIEALTSQKNPAHIREKSSDRPAHPQDPQKSSQVQSSLNQLVEEKENEIQKLKSQIELFQKRKSLSISQNKEPKPSEENERDQDSLFVSQLSIDIQEIEYEQLKVLFEELESGYHREKENFNTLYNIIAQKDIEIQTLKQLKEELEMKTPIKKKEKDYLDCIALWQKNENEWEEERRTFEIKRKKWKGIKILLKKEREKYEADKSFWEELKAEYEDMLKEVGDNEEKKRFNKTIIKKNEEIQRYRAAVEEIEINYKKEKEILLSSGIVADKQFEIDGLRRQLDKLENSLKKEQENLKVSNKISAEKDIEINRLKGIIVQIDLNHSKEKEIFEDSTNIFNQKDKEIKTLKQNLEETQVTLEQLQGYLTNAGQTIENKSLEISNLQFRNERLESDKRKFEESLQGLNQKLLEKNKEIYYLKIRIEQLEKAQKEDQEMLQTCNETILENELEIQILKEGVARLENLQVKDQEDLQSLRRALSEKDLELSRLLEVEDGYKRDKETLTTLTGKIDEKNSEIYSLKFQIEDLQKTIKHQQDVASPSLTPTDIESEFNILRTKYDQLEIKSRNEQNDLQNLNFSLAQKESEIYTLKTRLQQLETAHQTEQENRTSFSRLLSEKETEIKTLLTKIDDCENSLKLEQENSWALKENISDKDSEIKNLLERIKLIEFNLNKDQDFLKSTSKILLEKDAEIQSLKLKIDSNKAGILESDIISQQQLEIEKLLNQVRELESLEFKGQTFENLLKEKEIQSLEDKGRSFEDILREKDNEIKLLLQEIELKKESYLKDKAAVDEIIRKNELEILNLNSKLEKTSSSLIENNQVILELSGIISKNKEEIQFLRIKLEETNRKLQDLQEIEKCNLENEILTKSEEENNESIREEKNKDIGYQEKNVVSANEEENKVSENEQENNYVEELKQENEEKNKDITNEENKYSEELKLENPAKPSPIEKMPNESLPKTELKTKNFANILLEKENIVKKIQLESLESTGLTNSKNEEIESLVIKLKELESAYLGLQENLSTLKALISDKENEKIQTEQEIESIKEDYLTTLNQILIIYS